MDLTLSNDEARILDGLLRDYLPGLKREVAATDSRDFRHLLVQRQELCERIMEQLRIAITGI